MARQPNILLITSDQQHFSTLGVVNPRIRTPSLDRLAGEGTYFDRAYCTNPTCTPSRASIITGMYPSAHGAWSLGTKLLEDVPTVGDTLQAGSYVTSLVGKAHFQPTAQAGQWTSYECHPTLRDLAFWERFRGPWYGFRDVETARMHADEHLVGGHYAIWMQQKGLENWEDYFQPYPPDPKATKRHHKWELPEAYHYSVWTAEKTIEYIRQYVRERQPFFCWTSFHDPHPPYLVPEPWDTMYDPAEMEPGRFTEGEFDDKPPQFAMTRNRHADWSIYQETPFSNHGFHCQVQDEPSLRADTAVYYGMISLMDQQIGRILDALDDLGITRDTLVVFTTDHGHLLGHHGLTAKGAHLYEDVIRVPMLVRWPGAVPAGTTSDSLQSLVDLPVTFLRAAGIDVPSRMQGVDQLDVWLGQRPSVRDHVICEHRHQLTAIHMRSLITQHHKLTVYRDQDYGELYDLQQDPGELKNHWVDPAYAPRKSELLRHFINAELKRESTPMPRISSA